MEKTRVNKGCTYFWIDYRDDFSIHADTDWRQEFSTKRFTEGNYYLSFDEANKVISKLRAVLKGAEVIEIPSEEEIETKAYMTAMSIVGEGDYGRDYYEGFITGVEWLKSKIVK